ncbi:MAG: SpoIIE family protein phosphatase [Pedosphaera parvula]|nr:SpoIIE family protein phosphatase [Pedosphaera parvula]
MVRTFADFLAIQIATARMQEEQMNLRLVMHELSIARNIQRALLPKTLPQPPRFGLAGFCESAREVGGDFYDVVELTSDSLLLVIADVMGKGIPAAMFAATLRTLVRSMSRQAPHPGRLLAQMNRLPRSLRSRLKGCLSGEFFFRLKLTSSANRPNRASVKLRMIVMIWVFISPPVRVF